MPKSLNDQQRAQLDGIVEKMAAAGEPDDAIQFVVDDFKTKYTADSELGSTDVPSDDSMTPGMLTGEGVAAWQAGKYVKPAMKVVGGAMAKSKGRIASAIGGVVGASGGAALGSTVGGPVGAFGGASLGSDVGRAAARKAITPATKAIGQTVFDLATNSIPKAGLRGAAIQAGRRGLNFGLQRVLPGVGMALTAYDVLSRLGPRLAGIPDAIRKNPNMLAASGSYKSPEDEAMIRALMAQENGN